MGCFTGVDGAHGVPFDAGNAALSFVAVVFGGATLVALTCLVTYSM